MVHVTLKIKSFCNQAPVDVRLRSFDSLPIIIGRSTSCDYHLPDESRYISSNHALITWEENTFYLHDTSVNGVYHNAASEPIGRGRKICLQASDDLTLGDYTLTVQVSSGAAAVVQEDPFADFGATTNDENATSGLNVEDSDDHDWIPSSQAAGSPADSDWPLEDNLANAPLPGAGAADQKQTDEDDWFSWDPSPAKQPDRAPSAAERRNNEAPALREDDLDWLPGTVNETISIQTPPRPGSAQAVQHPSEHAAYSMQPPMHNKQNEDVRPQPSSSDTRQALTILLKAAGVRGSELESNSDEAILEQAGQILAVTVDAIMMLLQSRAEMKNAIRTDMTTLARGNNNPMKFSYSPTDALTRLLAHQESGYMDANQAISESVEDLKLHQVALLEGMKAAVKSILIQFNPDKLSNKLEKSGGISANIPVTREAKLWKLFCEQYETIQEEAMSDFSELFGTEFRKAYERRIRQQGRTPDF